MPNCQRDQPKSWVGNSRHARICYQSDARSFLHLFYQLRRSRHLVVLVIADGAGCDAVVVEQLLRLPRIFARDYVDFLQHTYSAQCDVLKVADWCGDEIKRGACGMRGILRGGLRLGGLVGVLHARSLSLRRARCDMWRRPEKLSSFARLDRRARLSPHGLVLPPELTQSNRRP